MNDATPAERLRSLLAALVRAALMSDEDGRPWLRQAQSLHGALLREPAGLDTLSLDGFWTLAIQDAEGPDSREAERRVSMSLPKVCPLHLADMASAGFDPAQAAATIRSSAATG